MRAESGPWAHNSFNWVPQHLGVGVHGRRTAVPTSSSPRVAYQAGAVHLLFWTLDSNVVEVGVGTMSEDGGCGEERQRRPASATSLPNFQHSSNILGGAARTASQHHVYCPKASGTVVLGAKAR
eukprot:1454424-Pyramimonas_sp.AAC.1